MARLRSKPLLCPVVRCLYWSGTLLDVARTHVPSAFSSAREAREATDGQMIEPMLPTLRPAHRNSRSRSLRRSAFIESTDDLVLLGPPNVGKSYLPWC
jgi:hypothetical protein